VTHCGGYQQQEFGELTVDDIIDFLNQLPDVREKIQSRHCGKRNSKSPLINLYGTGVLGLIHSLEEG
jgi:hypothetical protein